MTFGVGRLDQVLRSRIVIWRSDWAWQLPPIVGRNHGMWTPSSPTLHSRRHPPLAPAQRAAPHPRTSRRPAPAHRRTTLAPAAARTSLPLRTTGCVAMDLPAAAATFLPLLPALHRRTLPLSAPTPTAPLPLPAAYCLALPCRLGPASPHTPLPPLPPPPRTTCYHLSTPSLCRGRYCQRPTSRSHTTCYRAATEHCRRTWDLPDYRYRKKVGLFT